MNAHLEFHQLDEKAKRAAAASVYLQEINNQHWGKNSENLPEEIMKYLRTFHFFFSLNWGEKEGQFDADLTFLKGTDRFHQKVLGDEDFALFKQISAATNNLLDTHYFTAESIFPDILEGYMPDVNVPKTIALIREHGTDDEKHEIAFLELFTQGDEHEEMEEYGFSHAEYMLMHKVGAAVIHRLLVPVAKKITQTRNEIQAHVNQTLRDKQQYYLSPQRFYDELKLTHSRLNSHYRFTEHGQVINNHEN